PPPALQGVPHEREPNVGPPPAGGAAPPGGATGWRHGLARPVGQARRSKVLGRSRTSRTPSRNSAATYTPRPATVPTTRLVHAAEPSVLGTTSRMATSTASITPVANSMRMIVAVVATAVSKPNGPVRRRRATK